MKSIGFILVFTILQGLFISAGAQTSYSWAAYPTRCTGAAVYTQPNMSVTVTGTNFANYGPQSTASACAATAGNRYYSPKYVAAPNASAPDWQMSGLGLGVDWANTGSNATVTIDFTTALCGPVQFTIYDLNSGTWGGFNPVWRDRVTLTGTNSGGTTIYPSSITGCANNTVGGANSNIISAGLNTGCTNSTHTITFNSPTVKTLTILYNSLAIDGTYGTDPDPQYIIISTITSNPCVLPLGIDQLKADCYEGHAVLHWKNHSMIEGTTYEILEGKSGGEFQLVGEMESIQSGKENNFSWMDPSATQFSGFYKIRQINPSGDYSESEAIQAPADCEPSSGFYLFPNPATEKVTVQIHCQENEFIQLSILDMSGHEIRMGNLCESQSQDGYDSKTFSISALSAGSYIVQCRVGESIFNKLLIVE
jgi:Secretion system C-terminal sorting domain